MKAITLWQPWASLVALGVKTIETRSWSTSYRGPLAIHAAARIPDTEQREGNVPFDEIGDPDGRYFQFMRVEDGRRDEWEIYDCGPKTADGPWDLPLGAVVATCMLADVVPIRERDERIAIAWSPHIAIAPGSGRLLHWQGRTTDDGPMGRPTWVTADVDDQSPYGDFTPGRYAWLLDDIVPLAEPVPARGRQQLWEWE